MSMPPETPPQAAHLHPLAVQIPRIWTSKEALAVFELIDDLHEKIWTLYDVKLQALLRELCADHGADGSSSDAADEGAF